MHQLSILVAIESYSDLNTREKTYIPFAIALGDASRDDLVPVSALVGAVVGILLLAAVVIAVIVVGLMCWMRRYKHSPCTCRPRSKQ
jgi:hypothetical protein